MVWWWWCRRGACIIIGLGRPSGREGHRPCRAVGKLQCTTDHPGRVLLECDGRETRGAQPPEPVISLQQPAGAFNVHANLLRPQARSITCLTPPVWPSPSLLARDPHVQ
ncbi:hypothetical protein PVAP13_1NG488000 [Panicum virgatum]|uniref:Secreted protein n=1 Tax=Panicum virgatum TaxID=38727 RepID=A0A8T0WYI3_PANVG|nr:hypothetical protein PVAP13_1NG488000 [Panicum virgatum]